MNSEDIFKKKLGRLQRWADRAARAWQKALSETEGQYLNVLRDMEEEKLYQSTELKNQEELLKGQLEQAGKDFVKNKYLFEKESSQNKADLENMNREIDKTKQHLSAEINRINQEKLTNQISFERQKSALQELYQEKKRHLLVTREKLIREAAQSDATYTSYRERTTRELDAARQESLRKINTLKDQMSAKQEGWNRAAETMRRELEASSHQKDEIEQKLSNVQSEKERELHDLHTQMQVSREQLDLDKVSLVEKAEDDQRRAEAEVKELEFKINNAERDLQNLVLEKENEKKTAEEVFLGEEIRLKETLKSESEKRDYEQKLFAQDKDMKERDLVRLREEYDKKKTHWDNQVKTLLMKKSLQDAEANVERMRVDREARVIVRSLEVKHSELQSRLKDLESRHQDMVGNSGKELDLMKQRWQWRKDRLWTMWQARVDILKKERTSLMEQLEHLQDSFNKERKALAEESQRHDSQIEEIKEALLKGHTENAGARRQREIQLELEKTRVIAQIKECETLVTDWMDKQKLSHAEFGKQKGALVEDLAFVDRYYRTQQDETELFLSSFQRALSIFKGQLERIGIKQDAA